MDPRKLPVSYWRERYPDVWCFICPLCEAPRRIPFRPGFGRAIQVFQILLTGLVVTWLTWPWLGGRGIVCLFPLWTFFEFTYRWRTRNALRCGQCGFDPYLSQIDVQWARREIESHWRKKLADRGIPYPEKGKPPSGKSAVGEAQPVQDPSVF